MCPEERHDFVFQGAGALWSIGQSRDYLRNDWNRGGNRGDRGRPPDGARQPESAASAGGAGRNVSWHFALLGKKLHELELSSDRVNVARELMQQVGIHEDQVTQVRGFADQRLRIKQNAMDPGKPENFADRAGFGKAFE